jgi:hypothetical protein
MKREYAGSFQLLVAVLSSYSQSRQSERGTRNEQ